jgi:hypothetical protein
VCADAERYESSTELSLLEPFLDMRAHHGAEFLVEAFEVQDDEVAWGWVGLFVAAAFSDAEDRHLWVYGRGGERDAVQVGPPVLADAVDGTARERGEADRDACQSAVLDSLERFVTVWGVVDAEGPEETAA